MERRGAAGRNLGGAAFAAATRHNIQKIIVFTAYGQGVALALEEICSKPELAHIKLIAITFPVGQPFTDTEGKALEVDISPEYKELFTKNSIPILRAHLPFHSIVPPHSNKGVLGQDLSLVESALNVFGGSMSLCIQAILIACDAGVVGRREHVIALTSDTAILAQAAPTARMLTELAVREILCKPAIFSIGRGETADQLMLGLEAPKQEGKILEGQVLPPVKP